MHEDKSRFDLTDLGPVDVCGGEAFLGAEELPASGPVAPHPLLLPSGTAAAAARGDPGDEGAKVAEDEGGELHVAREAQSGRTIFPSSFPPPSLPLADVNDLKVLQRRFKLCQVTSISNENFS